MQTPERTYQSDSERNPECQTPNSPAQRKRSSKRPQERPERIQNQFTTFWKGLETTKHCQLSQYT